VERTFAWLHQLKRLRIRWEYRVDIHEAFLKLPHLLVVILFAALTEPWVLGLTGERRLDGRC
jgi:hypothetical protein